MLVEVNEGKNGERFLSVFSVCGPADPAYFERPGSERPADLRQPVDPQGPGQPMFVMTRTFPRDRVRPRELRDAILEIARRSDQIEQQLTRQDQY